MKRNAVRILAVMGMLLAAQALSAPARAAQQGRPEPPKIIRKAGGVLQDSATRRVEPVYPPLAKAARVSGAVVVEVTVDDDGSVVSARAISGHPLLKSAAVTAAQGWQFTPTKLNGVPVKVIGTITFNFQLYTKEDFERVRQEIAQTPNNAELYVKLGEMYAESNQPDEAIGAYRQALVLEPDYTQAWLAIGDVHSKSGRNDEAIEAYQQATHVAPDDAGFKSEAFKKMGAIYFGQQRYQEAVEAYRQALEADGIHFEPKDYLRLGTAYLKLGDKESAMKQYRKLRELDSDFAEQLLKQIHSQQ